MIHFESDGPPVTVPPWLVGVTATLVVFIVGLAWAARATGVGVTAHTVPDVEPQDEVHIVFQEEDDGTVRVLDAADRTELASLPPGGGGFLRGVLRPLARERQRRQVELDEPYRLRRWAPSRITLEDPTTDLVVEVGAFGETSLAAFAQLLE